MAVLHDILASYRAPAAVVSRILARGTHEGRALAFCMGSCALMFVAQWPVLARKAHLTDAALDMIMGGALLGTVFILPLLLYTLAGLLHLVLGKITGRGSGFGARVAVFWALMAAVPLALLNGLTLGFVGPGGAASLVGLLWFASLIWMVIGGLRHVYGTHS